MSDLDITDSVLAELRSAADIVEVIGEHTRLRKGGRSWKGLCPFHQERTPSFTVDREKGLYHCFGCGAGGDVIHFVRQMDRLDFPEAVESLASRFGVSIPRRSRGPREDRRERLLDAVAAAQRFYAAELARPGNPGGDYLKQRGVPEDVSRRLGMGYAPDSWDALARSLSPAYPEELLVEAGLLQPRPEGRGAYDRFRNRLLFVLRDDRGRPVGFGGRALAPEQEPKYLNSPETPLFQKKRLLYGLSEARDAIRRRNRAVLVEGYFDHLGLLGAGIEETAASMGTSLTPEHAEKLRRLCEAVVVCYDGDPAGRAAARAALGLLLARGLRVSVVRVPPQSDPYDLLREEGPGALSARIEEAPDFLAWLLEESRPDEPGLAAEERSARISGILDVLREIPDPVLRHEECRRLSRQVAVPVEVLWEKIRSRGTPAGRERPPPGAGTQVAGELLPLGGIPEPERALLPILIRSAEHIPLILSRLKDEWLTHATVRNVVAAFRRAGAGAEMVDFPRQIAQLKEENDIRILARAAAEEGPEPSVDRVVQVLNALEQGYLTRRSKALQDDIRKAELEQRPEDEVARLMAQKLEIGRRIVELKPSRKGRDLGN